VRSTNRITARAEHPGTRGCPPYDLYRSGRSTGWIVNKIEHHACQTDVAFDQNGAYGQVAARYPEGAVIVRSRSRAVPNATAETASHLWTIAERGRLS
jgi:hypothetical protein